MTEITLGDFVIRYENLREQYPELPECSVPSCNHPCDITEGMGVDTSCAYHRLLFDYWIMEVVSPDYTHRYIMDKTARRRDFSEWMASQGKVACDIIVLHMAQEEINWVC